MTEERNVTPEVEVVETKEVKKRAPRVKKRTDEEIRELSVNKLTEKEKDRLIVMLKEELEIVKTKAELLTQNSKASFEQTRLVEERYSSMEEFYRRKLKFMKSQADSFVEVINATVTGGIN